MSDRLRQHIVVHGRFTPGERRGGVETFGRTLSEIFEGVTFTATGSPEIPRLVGERALVVCDNQTVLDWPVGYPVIGFQHGFALEKARLTHTFTDARLAFAQLRAARRANTVWVACARWIAAAFRRVQPARTPRGHVIHHFVDVERFDGRRDAVDPRLVLHDARSDHKGKRVIAALARALPEWRFEPLACAPAEVPARMRQGAAFLHLSKYEGNSIVCNEAMAMDLPCLFTDVGLCRDLGQGGLEADVAIIPRSVAFGPRAGAIAAVGEFLGTLAARTYNPRAFTLRSATAAVAREGWRAAIGELEAMHAAATAREVAS